MDANSPSHFMKTHRAFKTTGTAGFTLIEMLVVIVILGLLIAISAPGIDGILRSTRLSAAADDVRNFLSSAQQLAVAQNVEVEVRLYESVSGTAVDDTPRVRRLRTLVLRTSDMGVEGDYKPEGVALKLDDSMAISSETQLTSLLGRAFKSAGTNEEGRYVSFHFFPDGSTDLPSTQAWFLTILEAKHASQQNAPANFVTIQVHPTSGKLRTFRP